MGGQDTERFEEREEQAGNDDERNDPEELPQLARDEQQRQERRHRRQDREDDRLTDLPCPLHGAAQTVPLLFLMTVDVLADDDGVVDDDPEHQQEREAGHHVDRYVQPRQQRDGSEKRDRYSEADPQSEANLKEKRQQDEHKSEPRRAVAQHERQPVVDGPRLVLPDSQVDPFGHARADAVDVVAYRGCGYRRALKTRWEDGQHDGRILVETG